MLTSEMPLSEMHNVDWDRLTESQAAGFGVSLGIFNDAHEEVSRVKAELAARLASLASCSLVAIVLLVWSASLKAALVAVMVTLVVGTCLAALRYRRSRKQLATAMTELKTELHTLQG